MEFVFKQLLKHFGVLKLALMAWNVVLPQLRTAAKKTETNFDDDALDFIDKLLRAILEDKETAKALEEQKAA